MTTGNSDGSEGEGLLPRVIADAAAAAIGLPLGPAGSLVTAVATPYLEAVTQWAFERFAEDAKERVLGMLARAWHVTGLDPARFASCVGKNEQTRLLTATTIKAASSTAWPGKVIALGRLLAEGVIAEDDAEIDLVILGLAAMAEMERPHVLLLDLLVNYSANTTIPSSYVPQYAQFPFVPDESRPLGNRKWTAHEIATAAPPLRPALDGLLGTLIRHGLAVENDEAAEALEEALRGFERSGHEQASQIRAGSRLTAEVLQPHIPRVTRITRTWSSTELGERLLGLYRKAAHDEASM